MARIHRHDITVMPVAEDALVDIKESLIDVTTLDCPVGRNAAVNRKTTNGIG
jgi:hypothetical protein